MATLAQGLKVCGVVELGQWTSISMWRSALVASVGARVAYSVLCERAKMKGNEIRWLILMHLLREYFQSRGENLTGKIYVYGKLINALQTEQNK